MLWLLLASCAEAPECPPVEACPPAQLEAWESALLEPYLVDLRKGIRPHGDQPFGVCAGRRECERYIGAHAGLLEPGDHLIRAEVDVPDIGDGWKVRFHIDCELIDITGTARPQSHDREYEVRATTGDRGYRLQPMWMIQSPHPNGARKCTFSLTPVRPDGTVGEQWTGDYETPAPAGGAAAPGAGTPSDAPPAD